MFLFVTRGIASASHEEVSLVQSVEQSVGRDSSFIDNFNYAYPPNDRENKLLKAFADSILDRSVDYFKTLKQYDVERVKFMSLSGIEKTVRPIWVLVVVFILFCALAIVKLLFPLDFDVIVSACFNERLLQQVSKEDNMMTSWPYVTLYFIFSLALGLFITVINASFLNYDILNFESYMRTSLIVAVLFIAKILMIRFLSFVFELKKMAREYIAVLYLVYFNSMLILMPFLLLVLFIPVTYFKLILILFSVVASILFLYRLLRTFVGLFGNLRFSVFYLILYLCVLEVAPILILVKTLSK
ncbi:DUF4271 domain-containing protein [Sphingobacterium sp. UT-1RO-CII-1]|uniref:DUF4271 domain-containing protein n=1 Tax=Sphingobacterium sp. UT-1RO-CII-1 TaxID=2995225 RepID=UPI00227D1114|nr:DUF4271 domain-containing protein [Sphingobacterium sp. UT-1RO-CII-1]MCY4781024.1 DUF4271 domain-containing protein [Sphingobacterium sp. UT-1RO-CII-1]